jgi:LacI family transcriptional regulator
MILVSFNFSRRNIEPINACGMPVVLTNRYDSRGGGDRFDYVYIDTRKGIGLATAHLLAAGHRRIAYLGGFPSEQTGAERLAGYRDAMETAGVEVDPGLVVNSDYTRAGGYEAGRLLLAADRRPTAVVAANDLMAIGFMQACDAGSVRIPGDVSVVGMDNTDLATFVKPRLSSVVMREEDIGANAASLLIERILGGRTARKTVRLEPELVVRESSGGAPET